VSWLNAWLTSAQLVRASEAAALRSEEAAARALRRKDAKPVTADEESFTAAWRHAVRSMETTQVTATSSIAALAAAEDAAARAPAHPEHPRPGPALAPDAESTPEVPAHVGDQADRHREIPGHRVRARPRLNPSPRPRDREEDNPPRSPWNRAPDPPRHAGHSHARPQQPNGR
jgi:hypothetical protein